jgi:tRNA dimethylallyltransferase
VNDQLKPLLIFGPTASGKSAYALARARAEPSVIINADSMQVYRDLSILTARPTRDDLAGVPHVLYGHIDAATAYSTGAWLRAVAVELGAAHRAGLRPIIVGGTGLYFKALTDGFADVPPIAPAVRAKWRALVEALGAADLWAELAARDPVMASRLRPSDPQRIARALEVIDGTGRSLADWQAEQGPPLLSGTDPECVVVDRADEALRARLGARLNDMFGAAGLGEVRALMDRQLDPTLPLMRAVGLQEAAALSRGTIDWTTALDRAIASTWAYVRRQRIWARRHMKSWTVINL